MRRKFMIALGLLLLAGAGVLGWWLLHPAADITAAANPGYTITSYDRGMGNPKAPVTLIEYGAPVCPHCAEFDTQNFPLLKADYIDAGKVFYVFRTFPIRPDDGPAEKLARCMPQGDYFDFIALLFRYQPKWDGAEYPGVPDVHAALLQMARIAGMSGAAAEKCMDDTTTDAAINRAAEEGEQRYGLSGTPTFIVNGIAGPAGEPWEQLRLRLDAELERSNKGAADR